MNAIPVIVALSQLFTAAPACPGGICAQPPQPLRVSVLAPTQTRPLNPPVNRSYALLALINRERTMRGLGAVAFDRTLTSVARSHNLYQARRGSITHQGRDGSWPWDRGRRAGYPGECNENVGWSSQSGDSAQNLHSVFMQSPGHKRNLLDRRWRRAGLHFCWTRRGTYCCVLFGS